MGRTWEWAAAVLIVVLSTSSLRGATLPAPLVPITLPAHAPHAFGTTAVLGPDGLVYAWNGGSVFKQNSPSTTAFTSIGNVGSGSADPGPIAFSRNGSQILVGNGFGGELGHDGLMFSIPGTGGDSSTPIGTISLHNAFLAAPIGASNTRYFVDVGADSSGSTSKVTIFDQSNGTNVTVVQHIPGASASGFALDSAGRLYVGIGFGTGVRGQIRTFTLTDLTNAYNMNTPLEWDSIQGQVFNLDDNNSAAGMGIDSHGLLYVGGAQGVTVFDPQGHARLFDNGGYTVVDVDRLTDRVLITGFGTFQGVYAASTFAVPEPSTAVLALLAIGCLAAGRFGSRRRRRRGSVRF